MDETGVAYPRVCASTSNVSGSVVTRCDAVAGLAQTGLTPGEGWVVTAGACVCRAGAGPLPFQRLSR